MSYRVKNEVKSLLEVPKTIPFKFSYGVISFNTKLNGKLCSKLILTIASFYKCVHLSFIVSKLCYLPFLIHVSLSVISIRSLSDILLPTVFVGD